MPTYERSTCGCWTCRVRKKKCDEHFPICSACAIRGITCHGYGPKPGWIDGGEKEKKALDDLKREVKESLKHRKALGPVTPPQNSTGGSSIYEKPVSSDTTTIANTSYASLPLTTVPSSPISLSHVYQDSTTQARFFSTPSQGCRASDAKPKRNDAEATLLMNYLDHVFPLQFNCYVPPVVELGRGWLLALLTRTKPLYHAALALSAFHIHSVMLKMEKERRRIRCMDGHWEAMKAHHALAFQELQIQISESTQGGKVASLRENIEILACIIQLTSFELLRGGTDSWQIHLQAASSIIPALTSSRKTIGVSTKSASAMYIDQLDRGERPPNVDEIACDFLVGTFVWYDIISSASTRSPSFLATNYSYFGAIELDKTMGCENWAMALIARISLLEDWKREMQRAGRLSVVELSERGKEIEQELNNGLAAQMVYPAATTRENDSRHTSLITRIFAYSALTYLHTVISGAHPELPEIKASVGMTIAAFSNLPKPGLLQNLVWPFCVVGCMAGRDYEGCFKSKLNYAGEDMHFTGNYFKAFEVIQECWRLRETKEGGERGVDWTSAMESLGFKVLLV